MSIEGRGSAIGAPLDDLTVYLLDERLEPVPIGVTGEIFVGGAGVATGYLNRPDLTAERFIPDPFGATPARGCTARAIWRGACPTAGWTISAAPTIR